MSRRNPGDEDRDEARASAGSLQRALQIRFVDGLKVVTVWHKVALITAFANGSFSVVFVNGERALIHYTRGPVFKTTSGDVADCLVLESEDSGQPVEVTDLDDGEVIASSDAFQFSTRAPREHPDTRPQHHVIHVEDGFGGAMVECGHMEWSNLGSLWTINDFDMRKVGQAPVFFVAPASSLANPGDEDRDEARASSSSSPENWIVAELARLSSSATDRVRPAAWQGRSGDGGPTTRLRREEKLRVARLAVDKDHPRPDAAGALVGEVVFGKSAGVGDQSWNRALLIVYTSGSSRYGTHDGKYFEIVQRNWSIAIENGRVVSFKVPPSWKRAASKANPGDEDRDEARASAGGQPGLLRVTLAQDGRTVGTWYRILRIEVLGCGSFVFHFESGERAAASRSTTGFVSGEESFDAFEVVQDIQQDGFVVANDLGPLGRDRPGWRFETSREFRVVAFPDGGVRLSAEAAGGQIITVIEMTPPTSFPSPSPVWSWSTPDRKRIFRRGTCEAVCELAPGCGSSSNPGDEDRDEARASSRGLGDDEKRRPWPLLDRRSLYDDVPAASLHVGSNMDGASERSADALTTAACASGMDPAAFLLSWGFDVIAHALSRRDQRRVVDMRAAGRVGVPPPPAAEVFEVDDAVASWLRGSLSVADLVATSQKVMSLPLNGIPGDEQALRIALRKLMRACMKDASTRLLGRDPGLFELNSMAVLVSSSAYNAALICSGLPSQRDVWEAEAEWQRDNLSRQALDSLRRSRRPSSNPSGARRGRVRIVVSVDWEGREIVPQSIDAMVAFREALPHVPLTHFLNAAYYTKPGSDAGGITREVFKVILPGDERGLHIHGWRSLFEAAGVVFRGEPRFIPWREPSYHAGDVGHDVEIGAYSVDELRRVIRRSKEILGAQGLQTGRSFRCGGWVATPRVLHAIRSEGFAVDSSAVDGRWLDVRLGYLISRLREIWPEATPESQPFFVDTPAGQILEMPDTGALADYVTASQMVGHVRDACARLAEDPLCDVFVHLGFHQESAAAFAPRVLEAIWRVVRDPRVHFETLSESAAAAMALLQEFVT